MTNIIGAMFAFAWCEWVLSRAPFDLLVSTCERLSVMHDEPAGVVEILVQILRNTPYSEVGSEYPPPLENSNLGRSWHFKTIQFGLQNTPPPKKKFKFKQILAF